MSCCLDDDERDLINRVADLLYDATDDRSTPWPDSVTLGQMRSRLRGLADPCESETNRAARTAS